MPKSPLGWGVEVCFRHSRADTPKIHPREGFVSQQTGAIPSFPDVFPSCSALEGNHTGVLSSLTAVIFSSQSLGVQCCKLELFSFLS